MITLAQAQQIVERGEELLAQLTYYDQSIAAFERQPDMVQCIALARPPGSPEDFGHFSGARSAELSPVPVTVALDALRIKRAEVVAQLAGLGVAAP